MALKNSFNKLPSKRLSNVPLKSLKLGKTQKLQPVQINLFSNSSVLDSEIKKMKKGRER